MLSTIGLLDHFGLLTQSSQLNAHTVEALRFKSQKFSLVND